MKKVIIAVCLLFCGVFLFSNETSKKVGNTIRISVTEKGWYGESFGTITDIKIEGDEIVMTVATENKNGNYLYITYRFKNNERISHYISHLYGIEEAGPYQPIVWTDRNGVINFKD